MLEGTGAREKYDLEQRLFYSDPEGVLELAIASVAERDDSIGLSIGNVRQILNSTVLSKSIAFKYAGDKHEGRTFSTRQILDESVEAFFRLRGLNGTLKDIVNTIDEELNIRTAAHHASRKIFQTSYDREPQFDINPFNENERAPNPIHPLSLLSVVLESAMPLGNKEATEYLETLCLRVLTKEKQSSAVVITALRDILPALTARYTTEANTNGKPGERYKVDRAKEAHYNRLMKIVDYIKGIVNEQAKDKRSFDSSSKMPSVEGFYKFLGELKIDVKPITADYLLKEWKLPQPDKKSTPFPQRIAWGYNGVVAVKYNSTANRPTAKITIYTGNPDIPIEHHLTVQKEA